MQNPVQSAQEQSVTQTSQSSFTVKEVFANIFDVFVGHGWNNWSRFKWEKKSLKLIGGRPIEPDVYKQLLKYRF